MSAREPLPPAALSDVHAALERAEFDALETAVRYHEGTAPVAELTAAMERAGLAAARFVREQAEAELFVFAWRVKPPPVRAGH